MITNLAFRNIIRELDTRTLEQYWNGYFLYRDRTPNLHAITENKLTVSIHETKMTESPFIDSQQLIGSILTALGYEHIFHRQFNEAFPEMKPHQTLGMQLYDIMVNDTDVWVYAETRHAGHLFPHATYFIPLQNYDYQRLLAEMSDTM